MNKYFQQIMDIYFNAIIENNFKEPHDKIIEDLGSLIEGTIYQEFGKREAEAYCDDLDTILHYDSIPEFKIATIDYIKEKYNI